MPRCRPTPGPLAARSLLQLMWLASPALPVGGFSYSEVLEAAVDTGHVQDEAQAATWIEHQLRLSLGRADLPLLARAQGAWRRHDLAEVQALNDWVRMTRETSELRQQTEQMGRSLTDWLRQRQPQDPRVAALAGLTPAPTWPVAFALAALHTGAPVREVLLTHAFGWCENLVQAALKAVPLGQSAGQRILDRLVDVLPEVVDAALRQPPGQRQSFVPLLAILSARHEEQYSRLFRS
ncbi:urease accessory protein UreF [Ideonella livida]|uniref:Urease accessory protein UreF n=1 Tax=Ideonella livida TaxID=2707176 RepID=A0A7C9PI06_9BURK|nr:urease accessory protein UreF [Ideonella livida]NDY92416.1 urease accessory protein UreF [Ideonella livida]